MTSTTRQSVAIILALCAVPFADAKQSIMFQVQSRRLLQNATDPVDRVVAFARAQAVASVTNAEALLVSLGTGDLQASKAAYVQMRPEYEEIEHLYEVFGDLDTDIDARPYASQYGEAYNRSIVSTPGAMFQGGHRIEALLYRDGNVTAAIPWTEELISDYRALVEVLQSSEAYSAPQIFRGMTELAYEVAKKKFSSEEETWSDLSMLIFYHNLQGIIQMVAPWQQQLQAANATVAAELQASLDSASAVLAPFVNATGTTNRTYAPYSTVPVAVRGDIQRAFYAVAQSLEKAATALNIDTTPEPEEEEVGCNATAPAATEYLTNSTQIQEGLEYFRVLLPYAVLASQNLTELVAQGDVAAVKAAYVTTRPIYEQIEVLAASFADIDSDLDAREYAFPEGELSEDFKGYHRLERLIFRDEDLGESTLAYARGVEASLQQLQAALSNTTDLNRYTGALAFEGMLNLATEVVAKKVSSEEETSSDLSLLIFYNNWKGILSQALPFCPLAQQDCNDLITATKEAAECLGINTQDDITDARAAAVNATSIDRLLSGTDYKFYSAATMEQKRCIVERGYRVRDTLAKTANTLGVFDDCSPYYAASFITYPEADVGSQVVAFDGPADGANATAIDNGSNVTASGAAVPAGASGSGEGAVPAASAATSGGWTVTSASYLATMMAVLCAGLVL